MQAATEKKMCFTAGLTCSRNLLVLPSSLVVWREICLATKWDFGFQLAFRRANPLATKWRSILKGLSTFNYGNFEILQSAIPDLCILTLEPADLLPHCLGCGVDCGRVDLLGGVQCSVTTVREVEEDKVVLWLSGFKRVAIPAWCRGGWWSP